MICKNTTLIFIKLLVIFGEFLHTASSLLSVIDGDASKCQRATELKLVQIPQWGFSGAVELRETLLLLLKCKDFGEGTKEKKNATGDLSAAILHLPSKSRRGRKESQGAFKVPLVVEKENKMDT